MVKMRILLLVIASLCVTAPGAFARNLLELREVEIGMPLSMALSILEDQGFSTSDEFQTDTQVLGKHQAARRHIKIEGGDEEEPFAVMVVMVKTGERGYEHEIFSILSSMVEDEEPFVLAISYTAAFKNPYSDVEDLRSEITSRLYPEPPVCAFMDPEDDRSFGIYYLDQGGDLIADPSSYQCDREGQIVLPWLPEIQKIQRPENVWFELDYNFTPKGFFVLVFDVGSFNTLIDDSIERATSGPKIDF